MINPLNFRSFSKFLARNKLYTAINIFGLSISLMFVIIIATYTTQELSVDKFQENRDRITTLGYYHFIGSPYAMSPFLQNRYPEIEKISAVAGQKAAVEVLNDRYETKILLVDSTFYDIFSFRMIEGDPKEILSTKTDVIVSEAFARRAFGNTNPIGQTISATVPKNEPYSGGTESSVSVVVAGISEDFHNSLFEEADIIMSMENMETYFNASISKDRMGNAGGVVLFIMTHPGTDLTAKIPDMQEYFKEIFWVYETGLWGDTVTLTPMDEFYFSKLPPSPSGMRQGDFSLVSILISVGLLILIFAIINYINLTVAQTGFRAKEMASRRLLGASRGEIFSKFILESIMVCAFAFAMGLMFAMSLQNVAGDILQRRLDVMGSMTWATSGAYLALIIFMGVVSGVIPAIFISRYKPIDVVKGSFRHRSKMVFSRIFIVFQNVITISLIAASLTMLLQIRHMIEAPLGYNTENIIDIPNTSFQTLDQVTTFKNELKQLASVKEVSLVQGHPFNRGSNMTIQYEEKNISFQIFSGDPAFMGMMGIEVLKDNHLGAGRGIWINKIAEFDLGMKDGETITRAFGERMPISGVIDDFRVGSLLSLDPQLPPVIVIIYPAETPFFPWSFLVEVQGDPDAAFEDVRGVYERLAQLEFNGIFMQDEIAEAYGAQQRTYTIVTIFTLIAVLISMLGLLAMSTYFIQQRASEIAIRKVFGSTRGEMLRRLVLNFMRLVLIAFVLSVPVIWLVMRWWLSNYSYRVALSPWIFITAGAFAFVTAFVTVLWQSSRAANANPIETIKN